jgi:adenylate kinase family enzyme
MSRSVSRKTCIPDILVVPCHDRLLIGDGSGQVHNASMQRIAVVGSAGSGKTTVARELADRLRLPHIELDAIFHQPGWEPMPDDEFAEQVSVAIAGDRWITDGNYQRVSRPIIWPRADTIVFLDLPKRTVMHALLKRSVRRSWRREELWNGNREQFRNFVKPQKEDNLLVWAWTRYDGYRTRYLDAMQDPEFAHIEFVQLRSRPEVAKWLDKWN